MVQSGHVKSLSGGKKGDLGLIWAQPRFLKEKGWCAQVKNAKKIHQDNPVLCGRRETNKKKETWDSKWG